MDGVLYGMLGVVILAGLILLFFVGRVIHRADTDVLNYTNWEAQD